MKNIGKGHCQYSASQKYALFCVASFSPDFVDLLHFDS